MPDRHAGPRAHAELSEDGLGNLGEHYDFACFFCGPIFQLPKMKVMKITLRETLLFVLVVGLVLGWWIDHSRISSENATLQKNEYTYRMVSAGFGGMLEDQGCNLKWSTDSVSASAPQGGAFTFHGGEGVCDQIHDEMRHRGKP